MSTLAKDKVRKVRQKKDTWDQRQKRRQNMMKENEFRQALKRYKRTGRAYGARFSRKHKREPKCLRERNH